MAACGQTETLRASNITLKEIQAIGILIVAGLAPHDLSGPLSSPIYIAGGHESEGRRKLGKRPSNDPS